jgi:alpha-D-xyloside xylohydrolase
MKRIPAPSSTAALRVLSIAALFASFAAATPALAQFDSGTPLPKVSASATPNGLAATIGNESLHITVCSDTVLHVVVGPGAPTAANPQQPWMLPDSAACPGAKFTVTQDEKLATLTTEALKVTLSLDRGNLLYYSADGTSLLREGDSVPRTYEPALVNGEQTYHVADRFFPYADEAYYGLGQHQSGMFNYRGGTVLLAQNNTDVAIPLLVSNRGYALMWNTASLTEVDNRFPLTLKLTALAGDAVDYYFLYGPSMDSIVHGYRDLTGHAPMLPEWAYGLFQSKDRYVSQDEVLGIAARFRATHFPLDAIVQDWFWWKNEGDPVFNENFPDVPGELKTLHAENVHAMLSVWGLFDTTSANYKYMDAHHMMVPGAHVYDPTNPEARDYYWNHLLGPLVDMGWDAFWLDSAEPEEFWPHMGDAILQNKQLAIGNGARYTNVFPLEHTLGVQEHWRAASEKKRVFLLTRSAFLGQQRVGATVWSGDVYGTFWGLSHQVAAGMNFALSGSPYWTTDIGGYWQPDMSYKPYPGFQELLARWYEYGVFCPVFRTHGHREHNEPWAFPQVEQTLLTYDKLRYRLMPYIYSLAWRVHQDDYTMQRPLVMDWREDAKVWNIGDEFMFGPALLVSPVLAEGATSRSVYLPASPAWYDFWTGAELKGTQQITAEAPLDRIPLNVRAGSILPLGPEIEYARQSPAGPIELRVYTGADGDFALYQDEGDGYAYEKGAHAQIPIHWSQSTKTLTIGARTGSYPGMPTEMTFHVVFVSPHHGAGASVTAKPDAIVVYNGAEKSVKQ